jgi:Tol biopolymer transport system component/predicted Ser/Thr protein kinase
MGTHTAAATGEIAMELEGARLSHYRLTAKLGEGGMGVVYRAHDEHLQRDVAVKLLAASMLEDPQAHARLLREARMASALSHPNVATIFEASEAKGQTFIVMELVEGRSLSEVASGDGVPAQTVCRYGAQIADALDHAHRRGVVHRDLKLSNVMVTGEGRVKVLDFGLSRHGTEFRAAPGVAETSLTPSGMFVGTPLYLAPEVWRGGKADERSDIWALGIVLYQMATGGAPFTGATEYELGATIMNADPEPMPERVPPSLAALILRCLEKEPAHRFRTAAEVRAGLETLAPDPARAVTLQRRGSKRIVVLAAAVVVALIAAGLAWRALHRPKQAGALRQTQLTFNSVENPVIAAAISPDGRYLAYVDTKGFFVRLVETGETRPLPTPPGWCYFFMLPPYLDWFPDGTRLLATTTAMRSGGIWMIPTMGGRPRKLVAEGDTAAFKGGVIALSPDGARIAFLADTGRSVVTMNVEGTDRERPIRLSEKKGTIVAMAWSPAGARIAFLADAGDSSAWGRCILRTVDLKTARVSTVWSDTSLVDRTGYAGGRQFCWLPDGRIIFSRGERAQWYMETNLWSVRVDPRTGRLSGGPRRLTSRAGEMLLYLSATTHGNQVSFLSNHPQQDVYVADLEERGTRMSSPRRLTLDDRMDVMCGWAPDSRSVFFSSDRNGTYDLYRQGLDDPTPQALVTGPTAEFGAQLTADSSAIFYFSAPYKEESPDGRRARLMRLDMASGESRPIAVSDSDLWVQCASSPSGSCVAAVLKNRRLTFYTLDAAGDRGRELAHADSVPQNGYNWSLSPDGLRVLINRESFSSPNRCSIVNLLTGRSRDIQLPSDHPYAKMYWFTDGERLIGTSMVQQENVIFSTDLSRHMTILYRTSDEILSVDPSPDGRRMAFTKVTRASSVWRLQGF